ncbi:MAG: rhodanese-like domain-containing protein [Parachlamydiaceae bacterium]|nr:rhodanese-like domain-containing protein [Parachlamydiaceae bacterium]
MKSWILASLLMIAPLAAHHGNHDDHDDNGAGQTHGYTTIHTDELKGWYDQGKAFILIDARSKPYFEGTLLPKAKWVPADASDADIKAALPSKETTVVVYCSGTECPASKWLADRLVKLGYTNVYKYPEGLSEWISKGYPTTSTKKS